MARKAVEKVEQTLSKLTYVLVNLNVNNVQLTGAVEKMNVNIKRNLINLGPVPCHKCGKIYKNRCTVMAHQRLDCGKKRTFVCTYCNKSFTRKHSLKGHMGITCALIPRVSDKNVPLQELYQGVQVLHRFQAHKIRRGTFDWQAPLSKLSIILQAKEALDILHEIREIVARTECKLFTPNDTRPDSQNISKLIPLKTEEDALLLEEILRNEEQQRILQLILNDLQLERKDSKDFLTSMLSKIYTNRFAVKCSWHGAGKHFKVGNTKTIGIIKGYPTNKDIMDILIEIKETVARTEYKLLTINNPQDNSDICFKNNKVSLSNSKSLTTLLPVKTVEDVLKLEETLKNEEQQRKLKAMLNELEGKDCRNLLARMLSEIFTNKIAVKCSWHGYGEHFKVGNTKTIEIIKGVAQEYTCLKCSKTYTKKHSYYVHVRYDCGDKRLCKCLYEACTFQSTRTAKNGSGYFCEICNTLFSRMDYVKRHYMEQHANENRIYECSRCQKKFKRTHHLKRHSLTCIVKLEDKTDYQQQFNCCFCFSKLYSCSSCNRAYKFKRGLLQHQKYECGKPKQFACAIEGCDYRAKVKGNVKQHLVKKHKIMFTTYN
ncbi:zinc finger protein 99-like [Anoplophora glabripennis]|uniref:zinc finger protein 99-like n=1 Tax=Anoplophora glabripennis TaxID=217634 RepID=UPI000C7786F6|nr:zinc finger protein 99-like [Anoplophora glabripennis]